MIRILLTGFGAFPGAPANPTQAVVEQLARRWTAPLARSGIALSTAVLPVVYANVQADILGLIGDHAPDVIVHLGLAGRRKTISIETRAKNRLSAIHPDAARRLSGRYQIESGAPFLRKARWPAQRLETTLKQAGVPAHRSIDAGDYLCNQALFISLGQHRGLCGFIHVPPLFKRRRLVRRSLSLRRTTQAQSRRPTMVQMEHAVLAAIRLLAREHRKHGDLLQRAALD